jgi:hypothetical protein
MSRRMSCSMTIDAVRSQTKTVTRRHVDTWKNLTVGDRLTLIEKGMGLPKGASQVVICEVEIVNVRVERLGRITADDVVREGLSEMTELEFMEFWAKGHGYGSPSYTVLRSIPCRRIEWRYLAHPEYELDGFVQGPARVMRDDTSHPATAATDAAPTDQGSEG